MKQEHEALEDSESERVAAAEQVRLQRETDCINKYRNTINNKTFFIFCLQKQTLNTKKIHGLTVNVDTCFWFEPFQEKYSAEFKVFFMEIVQQKAGNLSCNKSIIN